MELSVIATGSRGNSYVLRAEDAILLLDAGVPVRKIVEQVDSFDSVVGCVVTHEHMDHAASASALAKFGIPVLASEGTISELMNRSPTDRFIGLLRPVKPRSSVTLFPFMIMPFEVQHDATEPLGFLIRHIHTGETLIYATDTYYLRYIFPGVHYWVIECNFVDDLVEDAVESGEIPKPLRDRLMQSHMSLRRLKDLFRVNDLQKARKIILVHLSDDRSDERRMVEEITTATGINTVAADAGMTIALTLAPF